NEGNLRQVITKNPQELTWKKIIRVLYNISLGLSIMHRDGYYHKDFHSGNISNSLIDGDVVPVISDFGLCRPAHESSADNTVYGVIPYVAPEVLCSEGYSFNADIHGFGMMMWEMLSGEPPFI